jgi:hypothetical protein
MGARGIFHRHHIMCKECVCHTLKAFVQSWTVPGETLVGKVEVEVEEVVEVVEVVEEAEEVVVEEVVEEVIKVVEEVIKVEEVVVEEVIKVVIKVVEEVVEVKRPRHQQTKRKSIFPV